MNNRKIRYQVIASICLTITLLVIFFNIYLMAKRSGNTTYSTTPQIVSAIDVAHQIDCGRVQDQGPADIGGAIDVASCWKNGKKYGIDVFVSKDSRDKWLKMTEQLGVAPKWEASTWVAYPSVDHTKTTL